MLRQIQQSFVVAISIVLLSWNATSDASERRKILIPSSLDGTEQPSYLILPDDWSPEDPPVPLLVSLHSWSGDVEQRNLRLERLTTDRGWLYLFPHFRGVNNSPDACGSAKAQQDILDAVAWVRDRYPVDPDRVYLTGSSGGGHMTMLMVGRHPELWAAASAWVGISDLPAWYRDTSYDRYREMMRQVFGGPPGQLATRDQEYRERSPLTHLKRASGVPLDLAAGIRDGHEGSVSIRHTLRAFNVLARAAGGEPLSEREMDELASSPTGRLSSPQATDRVEDPVLGRAIYLRRRAGKARITIFEGGHESVPESVVDWLARHSRSR